MRVLQLALAVGVFSAACSGAGNESVFNSPTGPSRMADSAPAPSVQLTPSVDTASPSPVSIPEWLKDLCPREGDVICRLLGWSEMEISVEFHNVGSSTRVANLTSYCLYGPKWSDQKTYEGGSSARELVPGAMGILSVNLLSGKALQVDAYTGAHVVTPPHPNLIGYGRKQGEYCSTESKPKLPMPSEPPTKPVPPTSPPSPEVPPVTQPPSVPPTSPVPPTPPVPPSPEPPTPTMGRLKVHVAQGPGDGEVRWSSTSGQSGVITGTGSSWWLDLPEGVVVTLTAVSKGSSRFDKWTGNPVCPTDSTGKVTVQGVNVLCTAHFKR